MNNSNLEVRMKNNKIVFEEFSGLIDDPYRISTKEDLCMLRGEEPEFCFGELINRDKNFDPELTTTLSIGDEDQEVQIIPSNERIESELSYAEVMCHLLENENLAKIAQTKNRELFDLEIGSVIYQFFKANGKDPSIVKAFYFSMDTFADPQIRNLFKKMFSKKISTIKNNK